MLLSGLQSGQSGLGGSGGRVGRVDFATRRFENLCVCVRVCPMMLFQMNKQTEARQNQQQRFEINREHILMTNHEHKKAWENVCLRETTNNATKSAYHIQDCDFRTRRLELLVRRIESAQRISQFHFLCRMHVLRRSGQRGGRRRQWRLGERGNARLPTRSRWFGRRRSRRHGGMAARQLRLR